MTTENKDFNKRKSFRVAKLEVRDPDYAYPD